MKENKSIAPYNSNNEHHGYQEWYLPSGRLELRGNMKNGDEIGYEEWHNYEETNFYIR
jgi:hypothetical protein